MGKEEEGRGRGDHLVVLSIRQERFSNIGLGCDFALIESMMTCWSRVVNRSDLIDICTDLSDRSIRLRPDANQID